MSMQDDVRQEQEQIERLKQSFKDNSDAIYALWHWGDGFGGGLHRMMLSCLVDQGYDLSRFDSIPVDKGFQKEKIPHDLRKAVFERDAYRCVSCSGFHNLTLDHKTPESLGGKTTIGNLQTMCGSCNSRKGVKVEGPDAV